MDTRLKECTADEANDAIELSSVAAMRSDGENPREWNGKTAV